MNITSQMLFLTHDEGIPTVVVVENPLFSDTHSRVIR